MATGSAVVKAKGKCGPPAFGGFEAETEASGELVGLGLDHLSCRCLYWFDRHRAVCGPGHLLLDLLRSHGDSEHLDPCLRQFVRIAGLVLCGCFRGQRQGSHTLVTL